MDDQRDLETAIAAAVGADVTVGCDRDDRLHDGSVRFTVYCEDAATETVREQLGDVEAGVTFDTGRSR